MDGRRARALLGVSEHATPEEIRRAFRARALVTHPDRGGDQTAFELVVLAFETLGHVEIRSAMPTTTRSLPGARPRFTAYDSPPRPRARRCFDDVLRAAIAREQRLAG
jgi:hypothetical protein